MPAFDDTTQLRPDPTQSLWMASLLAGAWRPTPPPCLIPADQLAQLVPLLLGSGAAGLAWTRIRHTPLAATRDGWQLQQAYRAQTLQAAVQEQEIKRVFALFRAASIEPVLIKGWSNTRSYPKTGMRPYGDLDLCLPAPRYLPGLALLGQPPCSGRHAAFSIKGQMIELHRGFTDLADRHDASTATLIARSTLIPLGDTTVRILSPEDHLRLICIHFLRHGGWRPLWLCDIAALVEARPADFDWDRCLGPNRRRADWVVCALGAAHQLLGMEVADTPVAGRAQHLPHWLLPAILRAWQQPCAMDHQPNESILTSFRLTQLPALLRARWTNPIAATVELRQDFNAWPRWPWQLVSCGLKLIRLAGRMTKWSG